MQEYSRRFAREYPPELRREPGLIESTGHLIFLEEPEHDEHSELSKKSKIDTEMYKLNDGEVQRSMQFL